MTDLDLLISGAVVTFLGIAGAYEAMRHRANESPVDSYEDHQQAMGGSSETSPRAEASR